MDGLNPGTVPPEHGSSTGEALVWYVSYGSNMARERLACYIRGGRPEGATVTYPGARDTRLPVREAGVELPGRLYFAGDSHVWGGGGMAFYDHDAPGPTLAKAYLVTAGQFADIAAQEMHRLPDPDDPIEEIVLDLRPGARHAAGPGHYETLVHVGDLDGHPMLTFTAPFGSTSVAHTRPPETYLAMITKGLREAHPAYAAEARAYLLAKVR